MTVIQLKTEKNSDSPEPAFPNPIHVGRPNIGDQSDFKKKVESIFEGHWLTNNGPYVQELERRIAAMHGTRNCVAICNGTVALEIAIRAVGLNGEVIVPSYTFVATAHALHWQGIKPVFADIDTRTHNICPDTIEALITPKTTGIIGVHLWGRPAPVEALQAIAARHNLKLIYDAAHAFSCSRGKTKVGNFGECEVFSFHATKVFNTFEGGAILTNDDTLAEKIRLMRNFGFAGFDNVIHPGTNGKLTEINAAMGLTNLDALSGFIESNRRIHEIYHEEFESNNDIELISYQEEDSPNYQYAVIEIKRGKEIRDHIVERLHAENILARKYFWPGCHNMEPYRSNPTHTPFALPRTEAVSEMVIVLPTGSSVSQAEARKIARLIKRLLMELQ
ncbi:DegT/DnrJ/EryC1/StrS family aminotransferase [Stenotrophomonas sp.]|uniref:DegT/DnrJ/EryC1/StrS family aminotransferase n=1 Tax=Stenotrophomonas sp. TaxID=69392 RepID=UPI0028AF44F6|nr:DegT/DnrJ/EryC1/StrS family aminotransferase [Stenotrophomonas sp.]